MSKVLRTWVGRAGSSAYWNGALICTLLYIIPRTAILGAIMLTGYLGGAIATMARTGEPFYFPVIFSLLVWLGLYLSGSTAAGK